MVDYIAVLEDREHEVVIERKKMEFVNTDHSVSRMKMVPKNKMRDNIIWEEPEEFIAKASDVDDTTYVAARPRDTALDTDLKKVEEVMRENIKPQEAATIDDNVEHWR